MDDDPKRGETWKWLWLFVEIINAGPKTATYRTRDGDRSRVPRDRFLSRFHRTGLPVVDHEVGRQS